MTVKKQKSSQLCAHPIRGIGSCDLCADTELKKLTHIWFLAVIVSVIIAVFANHANAANWQYAADGTSSNASAAAPQTLLTPATSYFSITATDVGAAVAEQMMAQGVDSKKIQATLNPGSAPVLFTADYPLQVKIQALQVDPQARRWQAQAYITGKQTTQAVKPISGRYETIVSVPVLKRQFSSGDVIEATDLVTREIPERQLRKDSITQAEALIGKSPLRMVSADRPIRMSEIALPNVIKKGQMVEMSYTTDHMTIKDQGIALEDGAQGKAIRVKNSKTGRAVTAFVAGEGRVETNSGAL